MYSLQLLFSNIRNQNPNLGRLDLWFIYPVDIKLFLDKNKDNTFYNVLKYWMDTEKLDDNQCISLEEFIEKIQSEFFQ